MFSLNVVLFEPEIPQNTGNIARTCASVGAGLHLIKPLGFSVKDRHLKRAGLDYWHMVDVKFYENINELSKILEQVKPIIKKRNSGEALAVAMQFHIKIIEICKNDMIIRSLKNCYDKIILLSWSSLQMEHSIESAKDHET